MFLLKACSYKNKFDSNFYCLKLKLICNQDNREWNENNVVFNIHPPINNNIIEIPRGCSTWYDGCNTCQVNNGNIGSCTRMICFTENPSYCTSFERSGH